MEQIVDYKNDLGNGYGKMFLCFVQFFIVSNCMDIWYFVNNNVWYFVFDVDECFFLIYQFVVEDNLKIIYFDDFVDWFLVKCMFG